MGSKPKTKKEWIAAEREIKRLAVNIGINALKAADDVRRASGAGTGVFERNRAVRMIESATTAADAGILELVTFMEGVYFGT
jgi:hypothetical protein